MPELNLTILSKLRRPTSKHVKRVSLARQKFHRLTVFGLMGYHVKTLHPYWLCRCRCGNWSIVLGQKLKNGKTKSCGCYKDENTGNRNRTHGMSKTLAYSRWSDMHSRCYNAKVKHFPDYGGRGITIETRWHSFENFYADMNEPPNPSYEIERRNNDGNYGPANCYWATKKQQARNKRGTRWITINGITKCMAEWLDSSSVKQPVAWKRLDRGWTPEEALGFKERVNRS